MRITKDHLPWSTPNYRLSFLWICPECGEVNAWNYEDAERAAKRLKVEVKVSHGSCFDNFCGHCGADIVKPDSPILAECYTHVAQEE
jgi:hypothetical protein